MKLQDWIWVHLGMGEAFTRWAILLLYGAFCALGLAVVVFAIGACSRYSDSPLISMLRRSVCSASENSLRRISGL